MAVALVALVHCVMGTGVYRRVIACVVRVIVGVS